MAYKKWSDEEDCIIRKFYAKEGSDVVKRLPGRNHKSVIRRASNLGIHKNRWTEEEISILKE